MDKNVDVFEHKNVGLWMNNLAKEDPEGFVLLSGDNLKKLHLLMGEPNMRANTKGQDWDEAWVTIREGLSFIIAASKEQTIFYLKTPTDHEEYLSDAKIGISIIEFLNQLLNDLKRI